MAGGGAPEKEVYANRQGSESGTAEAAATSADTPLVDSGNDATLPMQQLEPSEDSSAGSTEGLNLLEPAETPQPSPFAAAAAAAIDIPPRPTLASDSKSVTTGLHSGETPVTDTRLVATSDMSQPPRPSGSGRPPRYRRAILLHGPTAAGAPTPTTSLSTGLGSNLSTASDVTLPPAPSGELEAVFTQLHGHGRRLSGGSSLGTPRSQAGRLSPRHLAVHNSTGRVDFGGITPASSMSTGLPDNVSVASDDTLANAVVRFLNHLACWPINEETPACMCRKRCLVECRQWLDPVMYKNSEFCRLIFRPQVETASPTARAVRYTRSLSGKRHGSGSDLARTNPNAPPTSPSALVGQVQAGHSHHIGSHPGNGALRTTCLLRNCEALPVKHCHCRIATASTDFVCRTGVEQHHRRGHTRNRRRAARHVSHPRAA